MNKGKLLVISGPSAGVGKDTMLNLFTAKYPDWQRPPSTTTREPRPGEVNGIDYNFISLAEFQKLIEEDQLLEWFEVTGNLYGTLRQPVQQLLSEGKNVILRKEPVGALAIKKKLPSTITICLVPDSLEIMEKHLRDRASDNEERIKQRLDLARHELSYQDQFDHIVVNPDGHPEKALAVIEKTVGL